MNLAAVDIETACNVPTCPDYGKSHCKNDHSVHHKHNKIAIIGVYDGKDYINFGSDIIRFNRWYKRSPNRTLVFHGGKFDLKTLMEKGAAISVRDNIEDTLLMGVAVNDKVSEKYLEIYNAKRKEINAKLPQGQKHRVGTPRSLKTMAPYYLKVEPFWENPETHDDEEYNKLDCVYTYNLAIYLRREMERDGTREFYEKYLIPWNKLIIEAEYEGVLIDEDQLHTMYAEAQKELTRLEEKVHRYVQPCFKAYRGTLIKQLTQESEQKCLDYISKRIKDKSKTESIEARYKERLENKIKSLPSCFNLASSQQVLHILTWAGIDTLIDKRNKETNEWIEGEGTNKYVLKRAKVRDQNELAKIMLDYREKETEVQYLKQYINACVGGRIYCSFNLDGTRTGRLSSSGPNLQNVKGSLRIPFRIADSNLYSVYTVDSSQIEPRIIAYLTQDKQLVKLFQDGRDYHNFATQLMFPETRKVKEKEVKEHFPELRNKVAKTGDLSAIYGTGPATMCSMVLTRGEMIIEEKKAKKWITNLRDGMPSVMKWKEGLEKQYERGVKIFDKFGFPVVAGSSVYMTLFNSLVQGSASRTIFHASLMAYREFCKLKIDAKPLMWVHDEVVWRFPKGMEDECKEIVDFYMTCYKLETRYGRVPLACEGKISDRWEK